MSEKGISREHTIELLGITEDLPTLPDRFLKIQQVINQPNSGAEAIAKVIHTDQATTVMVMKIANSPAYNPMNKSISSLSQAIARLGTKETADIAMSMSLLYGFAIPAGISTIRSFWTHAYAVGLICKYMTQKLPKALNAPRSDEMFIAGLLHDIGKALIGIRVDLSYFEKEAFRTFGDDAIAAESKAFGLNHAEVGEIILKRWGLPENITRVVAGHYSDSTHIGTKVCFLADDFANKHMADISSIEAVHITLTGGMFAKVDELLIEEGLIPPPEEDEETEA